MENMPNEKRIKLLCAINFLSWFPFMVTDLWMVYHHLEPCAIVPVIRSLNLYIWMQVDGYLKVALLLLTLVIMILGIQAICKLEQINAYYKHWLMITMIFCLIQLIWVIIGSVMFWGDDLEGCFYQEIVEYGLQPTFYLYTWSLLIISYILLPINFVTAFILRRNIQQSPSTVSEIVELTMKR